MGRPIAAALLTFALLAGCGGPKTIEGAWTMSMAGQPAGGDVQIEFMPDKSMQLTASNVMPTGPGNISIQITGTWSQEGENMTMTAQDVSLSAEGLDPQSQAIFDSMQSDMQTQKDQMKSEFSTPTSSRIDWIDDNSFSLDMNGQKATFTKASAGAGVTSAQG